MDSYRAELRDLIDRAYRDDLGCRATQQMVHEAVYADLPAHMSDYLIGKGIRAEVSAYFRAKDAEGLPKYPEVNETGEHADMQMLSVPEFGYVHAKYVDRAAANAAQADKVRQRCLDVHGVDLEPAAVIA